MTAAAHDRGQEFVAPGAVEAGTPSPHAPAAAPDRYRPLSVPRSPSPQEADWVRYQARAFKVLAPLDPALVLLPACAFCGSDDLYHDHVNCSLVCRACGRPNSSTELHAGRLAR